jgi:hypothetical protein
MSRTPIPDHLVHRPEEVARNAGRFDQLCQLAEEIALPFVENALARETAATAAEALTSEAKLALEGLLNDAALRDLEEPGLLDEVRKSMEGAVPPPDEKERRALARDVAQVLMGTWVEILRGELSRAPSEVLLSDQLLPSDVQTKAPQLLYDAVGSLGINERETGDMMKTLRARLFLKQWRVELPFGLVMEEGPQLAVRVVAAKALGGAKAVA